MDYSSFRSKKSNFIDEFNTKFHLLIADTIIKNPNNNRLFNVINGEIRRNQIYFASKNEFGESSLVFLFDFKSVRKNDLFSKKYLLGFYSKLPNMKDDF